MVLVIVPALVALPFILVGLACLIAVIRVDRAHLPEVIKYIAKSLRPREPRRGSSWGDQRGS
jgi:hypothetical protein